MGGTAVGGMAAGGGSDAATAESVEMFVCGNGVHTDLVLPAVTPAMDWVEELAAGPFPATERWVTHFAFGWGDRAFYLQTRRWSDLSPATALSALVGGGPSVMHVTALRSPAGSPDCGRLLLGEERYRALVDHVRGSFRRTGDGAVMPLPGSGYGPTDLFFEAVGQYSPILTCNEWTGRGLRAAGVAVGAWTPFAGGVMRWVR
ncbi:TIGR02117 family protein [Azospirillum thermophilum]|uniref:TIGR02117 family protein n=2 Tax=Azospirillum thermophilum TaxID=2202148 RepID=A0A2S2CRY4_9PROT|nr:TIGR02117 family protein [Azospirillum thermophilum]